MGHTITNPMRQRGFFQRVCVAASRLTHRWKPEALERCDQGTFERFWHFGLVLSACIRLSVKKSDFRRLQFRFASVDYSDIETQSQFLPASDNPRPGASQQSSLMRRIRRIALCGCLLRLNDVA
jgi:hypothetical protein